MERTKVDWNRHLSFSVGVSFLQKKLDAEARSEIIKETWYKQSSGGEVVCDVDTAKDDAMTGLDHGRDTIAIFGPNLNRVSPLLVRSCA